MGILSYGWVRFFYLFNFFAIFLAAIYLSDNLLAPYLYMALSILNGIVFLVLASKIKCNQCGCEQGFRQAIRILSFVKCHCIRCNEVLGRV